MDGALAWALPGARFIHDAALILLFGGLLLPAYALRRGAAVPTSFMVAFRVEAWIAAASAVAVFALTVGGMAGSLASAADPALLIQTATGGEFGWLFLARTALLLACALILATPATPAVARWLSGIALAALGLTGHAREGAGWPVALHVGLDALHLLCAGVWIGALPWFGVLLSKRTPPDEAVVAVRRFSAVAAVAVAVLLVSGAGATLLLVGSPLALPQTLWGRLLILKVAIAGVMVALAAHNRWRGTPGVEAGSAPAAARLRRNARIELALGLGVLGLVGWIGTLPFEPPG